MPDDEEPPEKVWDEYDWERFLQQQDRKTEKYMELLERYIDDPERDQIIAREMGWNHLLNKEGRDWAEDVDAQFTAADLPHDGELSAGDDDDDDDGEEDEDDSTEGDDHAFSFETHPLYQSAFAMAAWIDTMFEECGARIETHPAAVNLSAQSSLVSAKLAAALSDDDIDELGMTIAYLKRALRGLTSGLDSAAQLREEALISEQQYKKLNAQLFHVRDGIVTLMGDFRAEWRRRFLR